MTTQNLMYVGIGLASAYLFYNLLVNREKASATQTASTKPATKSADETSSDFCGCGA